MWVKGEYFDDFDRAEIAARGVLDRDAQPRLFDRIAWFRAVWENAPVETRPMILRATAGKAQGWLFLTRGANGALYALTTPESAAFRPIFVNADDALHARLLFPLVRRLRQLRGIVRVELPSVPVDDGSAELLAQAFTRAGWAVRRRPGRVALEGAADALLPVPDDTPAPIITQVPDTQSWNALTAGAGAEALAALDTLKAIAEQEGAAGTLRIGLLPASAAGDGCIAAQIWLVDRGHATLLHTISPRGDVQAQQLLSAQLHNHVITHDGVTSFTANALFSGLSLPFLTTMQESENLSAYNGRRLANAGNVIAAKIENLVRSHRLN